jgi:hypothetical protein
LFFKFQYAILKLRKVRSLKLNRVDRKISTRPLSTPRRKKPPGRGRENGQPEVPGGVIVPFERFSHHAMTVAKDEVRRIRPTEAEAAKGIVDVKVTVAYCRHNECKKRFYFIQYIYRGGELGNPKRLKNRHDIAGITKRLRLPKPSDTVLASVKDKFSGVWMPPEEVRVE